MYLSRLMLNPRSRRVRSEVASLYELHRTVMRAFPEVNSQRVLFRLDERRDTGALELLVQSEERPDYGWLLEPRARDYLARPHDPSRDIKPFLPQLSAGQVLAFRLRANPAFKRGGVRLGLLREEEQRTWLERKGRTGGFAPLSVRIVREGIRTSTVRRGPTTQRLSHLSVRYDGTLAVLDAARLLDTLRSGIGPAKGFGFGLLSLAPAEI